MTHKEALQTLITYIPFAEESNPEVSKTHVAWQIDHSLKVVIAIALALKSSNPLEYNPKFSMLKSAILTTGFIPRGKARAPKEVNNREAISIESIEEQIVEAENLFAEVELLPENSFFTHHMFGDLNLKTTLKFIGIHTKHHIKIIKDIIK